MGLFESSGKMPADDLKLIVPNEHIKLSIAFRNGMRKGGLLFVLCQLILAPPLSILKLLVLMVSIC